MSKPLVSDALWQRLEPLLPPPPPRRPRFPGRKPLDYRKVLTGIVFVLKTGINWEDLPAELGWGCGKTCRAYDSEPHREELRARGIEPKIPKRRTEHGSGLGIYRWVVERTNAWLHSFRKLRLRTDPDGPIHKAFVSLGSALICLWFL